MTVKKRTRKSPKPIIKRFSTKRYSDVYYFARRLFFTPKTSKNGEVTHLHTSQEASGKIATEFSVYVPPSTLRRWTITPDKDFEGRNWHEEWDRRIALGTIGAANGIPDTEHLLESLQLPEIQLKSSMENISELHKQSLLDDIETSMFIDRIILLLLKEIQDEYMETGKLDMEKVKVYQMYAASAKERLSRVKDSLPSKEDGFSSDKRMGYLLPHLKTPEERQEALKIVRSVMKPTFCILEKKGKE